MLLVSACVPCTSAFWVPWCMVLTAMATTIIMLPIRPRPPKPKAGQLHVAHWYWLGCGNHDSCQRLLARLVDKSLAPPPSVGNRPCQPGSCPHDDRRLAGPIGTTGRDNLGE